MSKNPKSRSGRSKKKKNKSKARAFELNSIRHEQEQVIEQVDEEAPEQLNTDTEIEKKVETEVETEVEVTASELEAEAPVISDVQEETEEIPEEEEPEYEFESVPTEIEQTEAPEEAPEESKSESEPVPTEIEQTEAPEEAPEESKSESEPVPTEIEQTEKPDEAQEKPGAQSEPESVNETAEDVVRETAEESVNETAEQSVNETAEDAVRDTAENSVKEEQPEVTEEAEMPVPQPKVRKRRTGWKVIGVLAVLLVYCAAVIYGFFWVDDNIIDPDRYPAGTTLNGVDVSNMSLEEAKKSLTDEWNKHSISIFNVYGNEIGEIDDFDFEYDIDEQLEHALSPGAEAALYRFFQKDKDDISVKMDPAGTTDKFNKQYNELSIVKSAKGDKPSKNAYIDKSDTEFRIVKEVIGNSVDTTKLREAIFESISEGDETFKFRRSDFWEAPKIISTSKSLLDERKYCIKNLSFKIRLRNPIDDYTVPPSWLDRMIKVSKNGKVTVIDEQVSQFISEVLYPTFSSVGDTRKLKSVGGGIYTISGGTYGYTIDTEKEHTVLTSELKEREDVEREPYYSGKTPGKNWRNDIGNDFIEVSIEKQQCWVVRHGKTVVDTSVVTGVLPRHATPTGVYYIVYKATNVTLKGRNDDGSKYESHVNYWMPFYLGFGLHDANWRGAFGGTIYIRGGSHGCVNCPPSIMPTIFSNSYEGMPVIVH